MDANLIPTAQSENPDATAAERLLLTSIERAVEYESEHGIVILLSAGDGRQQLDVLCTQGLGHDDLAQLFLGLAKRHQQAWLEQVQQQGEPEQEIVH